MYVADTKDTMFSVIYWSAEAALSQRDRDLVYKDSLLMHSLIVESAIRMMDMPNGNYPFAVKTNLMELSNHRNRKDVLDMLTTSKTIWGLERGNLILRFQKEEERFQFILVCPTECSAL